MKKTITIYILLLSNIITASKTIDINTKTTGYLIRIAATDDHKNLKELYQKVATIPGGLSRTKDEITDELIHKILHDGIHQGVALVVEFENKLIGTMTTSKFGQKACAHVLSGGTILVDPEFQNQGIGTAIINSFKQEIEENHPEILRVEINARASNRALNLYEKLGFVVEGHFKQKIRNAEGELEDGIFMVWFNKNFKD